MWPFSSRRAKTADGNIPLVPGRVYHVVVPFVDHDGIGHPVGETWTFLRSAFLPYEDGLTLDVASLDGVETTIRLQRRPEAQGPVIDALESHLADRPSTRPAASLLMTRDSVCLADDIHAPHAWMMAMDPDADGRAIAWAILASGGLTGGGFATTWQISPGGDHVVFGWRYMQRFVRAARPWSGDMRARDLSELHVRYHAQRNPDDIIAALEDAGRRGD